MMISVFASSRGNASNSTTRPWNSRASSSARSIVRFVTSMSPTPISIRCRAASSAISPAPMSIEVFVGRSSKIFFASSTAAKLMLTALSPIFVSVLTLLATDIDFFISLLRSTLVDFLFMARSKASFSCPSICGSPTIMESRLEATLKICLMAFFPVYI